MAMKYHVVCEKPEIPVVIQDFMTNSFYAAISSESEREDPDLNNPHLVPSQSLVLVPDLLFPTVMLLLIYMKSCSSFFFSQGAA